MKFFSSLLMMVAAAAAFGSARGGDSSAGGGGGYLQVATGFNQGKIDVSAFGSADSALGDLVKFYEAGGAVRKEGRVDYYWEVAGQEADHALIQMKEAKPTDDNFYQLNIRLDYLDLKQMRASAVGAMIEFQGTLAQTLYKGMEKAGAEVVGQTLGDHDEVIGNIYSSGRVYCMKSAKGGPDCQLSFSTQKH